MAFDLQYTDWIIQKNRDMNRLLIVVFMLSFGYQIVSAQDTEAKLTTVIRDWDASQNIDHLNENYNIDEVSMDEIIFIKGDQNPSEILGTSSVSSSSSSVGGAATSASPQIPQASTPEPVQVNTPAPKPKPVAISTANNTSTTSSSASTGNYRKTSSTKKRTKMKRTKLKKKKFKKYSGKSCFRF